MDWDDHSQRTYRWLALSLVAVIGFVSTSTVEAQDWGSCSSDLDSLRRRASDAASTASETEDKHRRLKDAEDELRKCLRDPAFYDIFKDGCANKRGQYNSANSDYRSQLDSLRSSLDDVDSKVRSASSSCSHELTRVAGPPPSIPAGVQNPQACAVMLRYKGRLPLASLLDICSKNTPLNECKKCIGVE